MRFLRSLPWTLCLLLAPCVLHAQSSADTVYHLHGTVVNGATGRPIGRALVISQDRRVATMTNSEGHFSLDVSVPAAAQQQTSSSTAATQPSIAVNLASLVLTAQRPGFLRTRQGATVRLDPEDAAGQIVLRLMPAATIRGEVTADGAEGVHGVRVQLLRHSAQDGRLVWTIAGTRMLDADGSFVFSNLRPGDYTVATSEWSLRFPGTDAPASVTQQYPPIFLGNARTLDAAARLHLAYGESQQANLQLRQVPYYPVTIPVQNVPVNTGVNVRVSGGAGFQMYSLGWNGRTAEVTGALPDGDYVVSVTTQGPQQSVAQVPLHVSGAPVVHAPAGLAPAQTVRVLVRDERTHPDNSAAPNRGDTTSSALGSPGFFLSVHPEDPAAGGGAMMQSTVNGQELQNLTPGRYYLQCAAFNGSYVSSVEAGGLDLLREPLVVSDSGSTAPVEVTLRDDGGTIAGTVDLRKAGLTSASVLAIPTGRSGRPVFGYASADGQFQIGGVPPGTYRVFALSADSPQALPYMDTEAMRPFDGDGASVAVSSGQTAQVIATVVSTDGNEIAP